MGSRQWGHPAISSLLRVKIYDFAMYMDGKEVHTLHLCFALLASQGSNAVLISSAWRLQSLMHAKDSCHRQN